jgi:DsbC/DsbD-like thiol-disulfide interchange protein
MTRLLLAAVLAVTTLSATALAQMPRPRAALTARGGGEPARAGESVRLELDVTLPPGLHVQSNKPRDPSLIPTTLTLTPPSGIDVAATTYPPPSKFTLSGSSQVLDVFGEHFTIAVQIAIGADIQGDIVVPARLHYQACDASTCFAPANETTQWTLRVAGGKK